jgi:hypothetical protein
VAIKHTNNPKRKLNAQPGVPVAFSIVICLVQVDEKEKRNALLRDPRQVKNSYKGYPVINPINI